MVEELTWSGRGTSSLLSLLRHGKAGEITSTAAAVLETISEPGFPEEWFITRRFERGEARDGLEAENGFLFSHGGLGWVGNLEG